MILTPNQVTHFRKKIKTFYAKHGRKFPWRETTDPYKIVISEVMLQQTQTERVVPKYRVFIQQFPNFPGLATASLAKVLSAWQGLGYNRRALALKKLAEIVINEHGGQLPNNYEALLLLPGIGPATASSILTFAFNQPVVFIETNIRRVFIHQFFSDRAVVNDKELLPLIEQTLDRDNPREWYWALMDYGNYLAKIGPNPNRRSHHYTKQSKFSGSNRQLRGQILKYLLENPNKTIKEIVENLTSVYSLIHTDLQTTLNARVEDCLKQLIAEGFVVGEKRKFSISHD